MKNVYEISVGVNKDGKNVQDWSLHNIVAVNFDIALIKAKKVLLKGEYIEEIKILVRDVK